MARFIRKARDFIFNTWAIARTYTIDLSGKERCAVEILADKLVCALCGVGDIAGQLGGGKFACRVAKVRWILIARVLL